MHRAMGEEGALVGEYVGIVHCVSWPWAKTISFGRAPLLVLALVAVAAAFTTAAIVAQPAPTVIHLATIPLEASAEIYYAQQSGAFAKAGLDVETQPAQSSEAVAAAVASNAVDVGFGALPPVVIAHNKGIPFVYIAPASLMTTDAPSAALLVAPASSIRTGRDLDGKVVAVPGIASLNDYGARAWIDQHGGDSRTVKLVELGFSAMPAALAAGHVDAISTTEPFVALAKRTARILGYPNAAIAPTFIGTGYFATSQWASSHADVVARFAKVIRDTAVWANANPKATAPLLAAYTKLSPEVIETMVRARFAETLNAPLMQPLVDVSARYGGFPTFPASELIYVPARSDTRASTYGPGS